MIFLHAMGFVLLIATCFLLQKVMSYRLGWTTLDKDFRIVTDNIGKIEDMVLPAFIKGEDF